MPFDEEEEQAVTERVKLKQVSSQKSIFDNQEKKPSKEDLEAKANVVENRINSNKVKGSQLATKFKKIMTERTLLENKSVFEKDAEKELLTDLISFANELNNDPNESEGIGSLALISIILKNLIDTRDRINKLEYNLLFVEKSLKQELSSINKKISEISGLLDKTKTND